MVHLLTVAIVLQLILGRVEPIPACCLPGTYTNTTAGAERFVSDYSTTAGEVTFHLVSAKWNYSTNITDYNSQQQVKALLDSQVFTEAWGQKAKQLFPAQTLRSFPDCSLRRRINSINKLGAANLPEGERRELNRILSTMVGLYSKTKVCPKPEECWSMVPELTHIMATSRSYEKLLYAWESWHDAAGVPIRTHFSRYVELSNKGHRGDGYQDTGEYWRSKYESTTFEQDMEEIFRTIEPLYQNLHAFVRRKLYNQYGPKYINLKGPIPAHLLGNMWAQKWTHIYELMIPFPDKPSVTVTPEMIKQGYNVSHMFHLADNFFTSLGLIPMPPEFWAKSMLEKPTDRKVVCHASAWDFHNHKDFRIKMCTVVSMEDLITAHHEMGHVQYYLQYKDQPASFQNGANPGFHEAIGDVMALSVSTNKHLHRIGLLKKLTTDTETDINYLLHKALSKVAFLPFGYLIDQWRWSVFSGRTRPQQYNMEWWRLRTKYQGVCPPVPRTERNFDPGAKYHVAADTAYIRYFFSYILQFQLHERLCQEANHSGPLHTCDIYGSTAAGALLARILRSGRSKPWQQVLQEAIGTNKLDAGSLMRYFEPVIQWLEVQNKGETLGWPDSSWVPPVPDGYRDIQDG